MLLSREDPFQTFDFGTISGFSNQKIEKSKPESQRQKACDVIQFKGPVIYTEDSGLINS